MECKCTGINENLLSLSKDASTQELHCLYINHFSNVVNLRWEKTRLSLANNVFQNPNLCRNGKELTLQTITIWQRSGKEINEGEKERSSVGLRAPGLSQRWTCNETSVGNTGQPYGKDEWKERERKKGGWWRTDGWTDGRMGKNEREESERKRASLPTGPLARHWSKTPLVKRKRKT